MYKNCPDELVADITSKMNSIRASGYKCPTTYNEYWNTVDDYWIQLLELFARFLPSHYTISDDPYKVNYTYIVAETYRRNKDPKILELFYRSWAAAPDNGSIHLLDGWNVLCDLCSEDYLLDIQIEEIEELATELQKQQAASVAIDSYDNTGTYIDELRKMNNTI